MITYKAGNKELEFYSSIDELPVERYMQFQAVALQDAGIGSTVEAYDRHLEQAFSYLKENRVEDAMGVLQNQRFNVFFVMAKINTNSLMLACLCNKIGKELRMDISDEGLQVTAKLINKAGFNQAQAVALCKELKKKSITN